MTNRELAREINLRGADIIYTDLTTAIADLGSPQTAWLDADELLAWAGWRRPDGKLVACQCYRDDPAVRDLLRETGA